MHREYAHLRKNIVHNREYRLLNLAGILCACDEHDVLLVVNHDSSLGTGAVALGITFEARSSNDCIILFEVSKILCARTAEKLMNEQVLRSKLIHDAE